MMGYLQRLLLVVNLNYSIFPSRLGEPVNQDIELASTIVLSVVPDWTHGLYGNSPTLHPW